MPLFSYNRNIPDGPNNPSVDQPKMQKNTNSTQDIINVDHFSFNDALGGLHKQNQIVSQAAIPPGLIANSGTLYTKAATGTQLFYTPDASGNEYRLTRTIAASFALFSTNTNYATTGSGTFNGGWTFLPGGFLLQYGTITTPIAGSTGTAPFPISFTNPPFSITNSIQRTPFSSSTQNFYVGAVANNQFTFSNSTNTNTIFWVAIGV